MDETLKLESTLARQRTLRRFVLLHYSPIQTTAEGEPPESYPFLGTSRMEEPLTHFPLTGVFHRHAHRGAAQGRTSNGIPVYYVVMSVLRAAHPERPPFRVLEGSASEPEG